MYLEKKRIPELLLRSVRILYTLRLQNEAKK